MRTVFGILLGIFAGAMLCGFGTCVAIDQAYSQERAEQGNLKVIARSACSSSSGAGLLVRSLAG